MPLPLSMRTCQCGRQLDMFGHHRAACPVAGVLGKRGFPLEMRGCTSVPRGRSPRVHEHPCARHGLGCPQQLGRRLEVVADGSLYGTGHNQRSTRRWCRLCDATVLPDSVQQTMTERSWWRHVLAAEVGRRWSGETAKFLAAVANATRMLGGPSVHSILVGPAPRGLLWWRHAFSA